MILGREGNSHYMPVWQAKTGQQDQRNQNAVRFRAIFYERVQPGLDMVAMQGRKKTEALGIPRRELSKAMSTEAFSEQGGRGKVLIFDESIKKHCGQAFSSALR